MPGSKAFPREARWCEFVVFCVQGTGVSLSCVFPEPLCSDIAPFPAETFDLTSAIQVYVLAFKYIFLSSFKNEFTVYIFLKLKGIFSDIE